MAGRTSLAAIIAAAPAAQTLASASVALSYAPFLLADRLDSLATDFLSGVSVSAERRAA